jgi:hypothetical protein
MKIIQSIPIWNNGEIKQGVILNARAVEVSLNKDATFYYAIYAENEDGTIGIKLSEAANLYMPTEEYIQWDQDDVAWDFVAKSLNLTIVGEYVPPAPPVVEEPIVEIPEENIPLNEENI